MEWELKPDYEIKLSKNKSLKKKLKKGFLNQKFSSLTALGNA